MALKKTDDIDIEELVPEGSHASRHEADTIQDIAEELDTLIPEELIEEKTIPNLKVKPVKWYGRLYLAAAVLSFFLITSLDVEPFSCPAMILFFLVVPFVYALWVYRVKKNCLALGAKRTTIRPIYAAILMMIPAFNTLSILPVYQEIWKASQNPKNWEKVKLTPLIPIWWIFRLILLFFTFIHALQPNPPTVFHEDLMAVLFVSSLTLVSSVLEVIVVFLITRAQQARIDKYMAGQQDAPISN